MNTNYIERRVALTQVEAVCRRCTSFGRALQPAFTAILLSIILICGGCAADVIDIDRTQANRTKKSLFNGEWFYRATVIEAPYNQGFVFEGLQGSMDRVRWEIRKTQLVAFRSYEVFMDAEQGNGSVQFNGAPVAVFNITSHFDVFRNYNTATGEQSNVLDEDTTTNPWFERKYIRVDWSQNVLGDWVALEAGFSAVSAAPYFPQENEEDNPERTRVGDDYIDAVGHYDIFPDEYNCWSLFEDPTFCGRSQVKIRLSFMKIAGRKDAASGLILRDYIPLEYPDVVPVTDEAGNPYRQCSPDGTCERTTLPVFERFGYFRHERLQYDDKFQWTRDGRLFLGHRHNMWKRSHDSNGVPIPAVDREPGKIVYYKTVDYPTDIFIEEASTAIARDWDRGFIETYVGLRQTKDSGYTEARLRLDLGISANDYAIFELRDNDCSIDTVNNFAARNNLVGALADYNINTVARGNLKRACAILESLSDGEFQWQRLGDLRYSFFNWVDTPQVAGPLGYGPSSADPVTGEIISATANLFGAGVDAYAAYAADVIQLQNGDIEVDEVTTGETIREHMANSSQNITRSIDPSKLRDFAERMQASMGDGFGSKIPQVKAGALESRGMDSRVFGDGRGAQRVDDKNMEFLHDIPVVQELLVNDDIQRVLYGSYAYQPGQAVNAITPDENLVDVLFGEAAKRRERTRLDYARDTVLIASPEDFSDTGLIAVAADLKGKSREAIYNFMRQQIYRGVMAHEVGHTLGLRHNFSGSWDALNFHPKFWESWDPVTGKIDRSPGSQAEKYMYSSIMDYDARFFADSLEGLAPYDRAAIKFGYGGLIEVFPPGVVAVAAENLTFFQGYQNLPKIYSGELSCSGSGGPGDPTCNANALASDRHRKAAKEARDAGDEATRRVEQETSGRQFMEYMKTGLDTVQGDTAALWNRDHTTFGALMAASRTFYAGGAYAIPDVVPYEFCPDEIAGYRPECEVYDKGASYLEVTRDRMLRYDQYYVFSNFKRDRTRFGINRYLRRLYSRYFAPMANVFRYSQYSQFGVGRDMSGRTLRFSDFPIGKDWHEAGVEGLNFLAQVIAQPEPGLHCLSTDSEGQELYKLMAAGEECTTTTLDVPLGTGKYYYTSWSDEYYYKVERIGTFWDKYAAIAAITDNEGFFYRDFASFFDVGAFQLSYWSGGLQDEILELFSGLYAGGTTRFAWRYDTDAGIIVPAPVVDIYSDSVDPTMPRIESTYTYTLQYYSILLSLLRFDSMFDYTSDLSNYALVCLEGYVDCQSFEDVSGDGEQFAYRDPLTNLNYIAPLTDKPDRSIGVALLREATVFRDAVYQPAFDADTAASTPSTRRDLATAEQGINDRSALLDIVRQFGAQVRGVWR